MSMQDSALHKVLYTEVYTVATNTMGLFTHIVGRGTTVYGKFDTVDCVRFGVVANRKNPRTTLLWLATTPAHKEYCELLS